MQHSDNPKRIVLRFHTEHQNEEAAIKQEFFTFNSLGSTNDYYSHLIAPNESPNMHIVLDLGCRTSSAVDMNTIPYEVYKVRKNGDFKFEKLHNTACEAARNRCFRLGWGADRRYPDELDGDRPEQIGHCPSTSVS